MSKLRVHELAKELGISSKEAVAKLQELGEFVKSASSTIEAPAARKLREAIPAKPAAAAEEKPVKKTAKKAAAKPAEAPADEAEAVEAPAKKTAKKAAAKQPAEEPVVEAAPEAPAAPPAPAAPTFSAAPTDIPRPAAPRPAAPRPGAPRVGNNPFMSRDTARPDRDDMPRPPRPNPGAMG